MDDFDAEDYYRFRTQVLHTEDDIGLICCGSFYELPHQYALTNLTDIDFMFFYCDIVAIPQCLMPPRNFYERLLILQTADAPVGFAHLVETGELGSRFYTKTRSKHYGPAITSCLVTRNDMDDIIRRAAQYKPELEKFNAMDIDVVESVVCRVWPPEASEWKTRPRINGWPGRNVIDQIIRGGCHLVSKAPQRYLDHNRPLWRFSFSQAEVILINSWNDIQKYIYHLLRLIKTQVNEKYGKSKILYTYYFKTLMLWACEEKSVNFWNEENVEKSTSELIHQMIEWIRGRKCPHYFIPGNNIMEYPDADYETNEVVSWLLLASEHISTMVSSVPMVDRKFQLKVSISSKVILLCQLGIHRRPFTNPFDRRLERHRLENISNSKLVRYELLPIFRGLMAHCLLMTDGESIERCSQHIRDAKEHFDYCMKDNHQSYSDVFVPTADSCHGIVHHILKRINERKSAENKRRPSSTLCRNESCRLSEKGNDVLFMSLTQPNSLNGRFDYFTTTTEAKRSSGATGIRDPFAICDSDNIPYKRHYVESGATLSSKDVQRICCYQRLCEQTENVADKSRHFLAIDSAPKTHVGHGHAGSVEFARKSSSRVALLSRNTEKAMQVLFQLFFSELDRNHHRPLFFVSTAYLANFYYTGLKDYRKALQICEEAQTSFKCIRKGIRFDALEWNFSQELLPVLISTEWIRIFDGGIQTVFGFSVLCAVTGKGPDKPRTLFSNSLSKYYRVQPAVKLLPQIGLSDNLMLHLIPSDLIRYVRFRCLRALHLDGMETLYSPSELKTIYSSDNQLIKRSFLFMKSAVSVRVP